MKTTMYLNRGGRTASPIRQANYRVPPPDLACVNGTSPLASRLPSRLIALADPNRRQAQRFDLTLPLEYKAAGNVSGAGTTVNMSSSGVLFRHKKGVSLSGKIKLSIHWPSLLNGECPLQVVIEGRVIRSEDAETAVEIDRYGFYTRPKSKLFAVPGGSPAADAARRT